ncbi:NAD(P)-binding protein [Aureobasidium pullulans]|uniref:NAD(P)-binding protein n=1 Tax=Aureobasidium pullulans TaxID=5580 RepID=A0A4S9KZU4_AURPU|nr:NAD(P)-binding protein [Aureobasidium pullulans]
MAAAISSFFRQSTWIPTPELTEKNLPSQAGRVFIVTGGYAGIGYELSKILYQHNGTVYVAGRSAEKGNKAISAIREAVPDSKGKLEFMHIDLADLTTIKPGVEKFLAQESRLDVLTNNAGVMTPPKGSKTAQDFELQFGTNVLGSFLLTKLLLPIIEKTAASSPAGSVRVTFAGSLAVDLMSPTGGVAWTDNEPTLHGSQETNYGQSKAGNALLASALRRRVEKSGVISNAWNPGNLKSELQRHMPSVQAMFVNMIVYPVVNGAYTELFAGWGEEAGRPENAGKFIIPWGRFGPVRSDVAEAMENGGDEKLWEWCEKTSAQYA